MRRYSGQKALYEAMSRRSSTPKRPSMLARLRPQLAKLRPQLEKLRQLGASRSKRSAPDAELAIEKPAPMVLKPPRPAEMPPAESQGPTQTWLRPKAVQFNDGRIEVSLPYQFGIIIVLGVILVLMMGFWFGRRVGRIEEQSRYDRTAVAQRADLGDTPVRLAVPDADALAPDATPETAPAVSEPIPARPETATAAPKTATVAPGTTGPVRTGNNTIVLARHSDEAQLEPVQKYFHDHGVETRIVTYERLRSVFKSSGLDVGRLPKGDGFMLITFDFYNNPANEGTDGYAARQRIVEIGRGYKAPQGFESFARNHFSDAYGMKIAK
jgi:hypothetical protein